MDSIINAALEEICTRGASGIPLSDLWPSLSTSLSSSGLHYCDGVKKAIWTRLLSLPVLCFEANNSIVTPLDPSIQSIDESERMGLRIVADEHLRDSFVGLDDLNAANAEISLLQRRALERLAAARTNGITQCELAKEFGIKGNNIFYVVRNLECQQLIVRQSTTVREKESGNEGENGLKNTHIMNTNLIHLYRYAKNVNLNSQQKIEITRPAWPDMLESIGNTDKSSLTGDVASGECVKEDVLIKDYLPAMRAICDKLEEASEKVNNIKLALGYRKTTGHRAWRNIVNRLKDAGLVEEIQAKVNKRDVSCLRLLKKFDPKDFQRKSITSGCDGFDSENLVKHGKRGQITDQLLELPMEHRIYDIVDAEGPKGITILEVCKRLGLNSKKMYTRIIGMCSRFGMCMKSEIPNRTALFRVWTHRNYQQYSTDVFPDNCEVIPDKKASSTISSDVVSYDQSSLNVRLLDSCSQDVLHLGQKGLEPPSTCYLLTADAQVTTDGTEPQNLIHEFSTVDNGAKLSNAMGVTESNIVPSERPLAVSSTTSKQAQRYRCLASTVVGARREQRILKRLKDDKFILYCELYRWLKDLEKDKPTTMDRKTLDRTLNRLQQEGLCKITQVTIPVVTNFNRIREQWVILHPSVDNISSDLLDQIHKRQRFFEIQSRGQGSTKLKNNNPVTVLTGTKRFSKRVADKPVILEAMHANGFVSAKMVRAKLLHYFLWGFLSSLPDWQNTLHSRKHDYDLKNHSSTCQFAISAALKAMPLELFLQTVGSAKEIDDMVQKCRLGLKLSDLPVQEYKCLMDTQATGRLSCIIDILLRLKLIQLVREGFAEGVDVLPRTVPTHALELQPYIEEPLPRVLPSSNINALDLRPRIRHDFVLSNLEAVDAYWETLEYCYAAADQAASSHAFPGSAVHEVFHPRSWASDRVMTAEQRMELLKHLTTDDLVKKISFKECVKIARELKLTVEQVLRVSYDKQQSHLRRYSSTSKSTEQENHTDANNCDSVARKRRRSSKDESLEHAQDGTETRGSSCRPTKSSTPGADENNMDRNFSALTATKIQDSPSEACRDDNHGNAAAEFKPHGEDGQSYAFISQCAFSRLKPMRRRRFSWTDKSDRQLVMQYARRRATIGERFHRVDWTSLSNLPALPLTCGRRMAVLNSDKSIRRAVMRLCNLLGERYGRYLDNAWRTLEKEARSRDDSEKSVQGATVEETVTQKISASHEDSSEINFQQNCWDDFEDPDIQMAVDEVLRCKRMAKVEYAKRIGSRHGRGWVDISPTEGTNLDAQACVTSKEQNFISSSPGGRNDSHDERCHKNTNIVSMTGRRRSSSHQSRGKFLKLLNSRGIRIKREVCESLAVANAVELLKLVFLSNSAAPEVQTSLAATLQLYSEHDLFAAFNYLKEKEFMVSGHGSRPFVLSQKFWHNASSSPFPIDSGRRAAKFSNWFHKQVKNLEDGVDLTSDLQCGEIFHLFALVSSGEVFLSPCLPKEGIGEADEPKSSKSIMPTDGLDDFDERMNLKRKSDIGIPSSGEKVKKHKTSQGKVDGDFCSRREKGFPGIKVFLNRATIPRANAVQGSTDEENHTCLLSYDKMSKRNSHSDMETICFASSSRDLNSSHNFGSNIQSEVSLNESPWDMMTKYAVLLSSAVVGRTEVINFCPELFKSVHSAIYQAGEQGLNIEEISKVLGIQGVRLAEIVVDTLEVFQLAIKVNAYDCVRVVDSSYRSKYFIGTLSDHSQDNVMASYMKSQGMSYKGSQQISQEKHDIIYDSQNVTSMNLFDGHKVTLLDLPPKLGLPHLETQPSEESVTSEECKQVEAVSVKGNETGNITCSATGVSHVYRSILPWINGDGSTNTIVYKGLTRRVLGTVMQNPGILEEDILCRMEVLNPQSCRRLLEVMVLDNHITMRMMHQTVSAAPPAILQNLFHSNIIKPESEFRKHYFANPMSTSLL